MEKIDGEHKGVYYKDVTYLEIIGRVEDDRITHDIHGVGDTGEVSEL